MRCALASGPRAAPTAHRFWRATPKISFSVQSVLFLLSFRPHRADACYAFGKPTVCENMMNCVSASPSVRASRAVSSDARNTQASPSEAQYR